MKVLFSVIFSLFLCVSINFTIAQVESPLIIEEYEDGLHIVGCTDSSLIRSIVIPHGVTEIGDEAFLDCYNLINIEIPETVKRIGANAFSSCEELISVNIPESVQTIGCQAFYGCKKLDSVYIPDSVEIIEEQAFGACDSLVYISLPDHVDLCMCNPFTDCDQLKTIDLRKTDNTKIQLVNKYLLQKNGSNSVLVACLCGIEGNDKIPEGVEMITRNAFYGYRDKEKITIPASVQLINSYAFSNCSFEKLVILGEDTKIESSAFSSCYHLEHIEFPDCFKISNGYGSGPFSNCSKINSVKLIETDHPTLEWTGKYLIEKKQHTMRLVLCRRDVENADDIPESITEIGSGAFDSCLKLKRVVIPDCLTVIQDGAFAYASQLESIENLKSVERIGNSAFNLCFNLQFIELPESLIEIGKWAFGSCHSLKEVYIPESLKQLDAAFVDCKNLKTVSIPDHLQFGEWGCFDGCLNLQNIELRKTKNPRLEWTGKYLLQHEQNGDVLITTRKDITQAFDVPDSVVKIAKNAFSSCIQLTNITIPNNVRFIDSYAFNGCIKLETVVLPDSVQEIGDRLFSGCYSMKEIIGGEESIAEKVSIDYGLQLVAPEYFGNASSIEMDKSDSDTQASNSVVNEDDGYAEMLSYCNDIPDISEQSKGIYDLFESPEGIAIKGINEEHQEDKILVIPQGVANIQSFGECKNVEVVVIPPSVRKIGYAAFSRCSQLKKIVILGEKVEIENAAFACPNLTDLMMLDSLELDNMEVHSERLDNIYLIKTENPVLEWTGKYLIRKTPEGMKLIFCRVNATSANDIPASITEICDGAFSSTNIEEAIIPESVNAIGEGAFASCFDLKSVIIPQSVTEIKKGTFYWSGLISVVIPEGVKSIEERAFEGCSNLVSIEIPDSLEKVDNDSFTFCDNLREFIGSEKSIAKALAEKYGVNYIKNETNTILIRPEM